MSKFDKIFQARQEAPVKEPKTTPPSKKKVVKKAKPVPVKLPPALPTPSPEPAPIAKKRGRPKAKRSDPNYLGFTTYIHREVHRKVKMQLLANDEGQEMSELVEELLRQWLGNM